MEVLLIEKDPLLRDQVKVGLQQIPGCEVTAGVGHAAVNLLRGRSFDSVFVGVDPRDKSTAKLLRSLRAIDDQVELFVMTAERNVKDMAGDKSRFDIHAFVHVPLELREFFRLLGRIRERLETRGAGSGRRGGRRALGRVAPV